MKEKIGKYFGKIINFIYNFVSSTLFLLSPAIVILNKVFHVFDEQHNEHKLFIYLPIIGIFIVVLLTKGLNDKGVKDEEQSIQFWIDQDLKGIIYKILTVFITVSTIIFQKSKGIIFESISLIILISLCELYIRFLTKLANKKRKIENKRYNYFFDKRYVNTLSKLSNWLYKKKEDYYLFIIGFKVNTILFLFYSFLLVYFSQKNIEILEFGIFVVIICAIIYFFPSFKSKNKNEIINLSEAKELLKTKFNGMTKKEKKEFLKKVDSYINPPK